MIIVAVEINTQRRYDQVSRGRGWIKWASDEETLSWNMIEPGKTYESRLMIIDSVFCELEYQEVYMVWVITRGLFLEYPTTRLQEM